MTDDVSGAASGTDGGPTNAAPDRYRDEQQPGDRVPATEAQAAEAPAAEAQAAGRARRTGRLVRFGVAGAVLTFAALVLIPILAIRPFQPADESAHVDYAIQVAHGRLPVAGPIIHPEFAGQRATAQYVSNHPPLYYAIAGPVLRLALAAHHAEAGLLAVRALSILFGAAAIVLIAVFAGSFAERLGRTTRAQLMVVSAGVVATLPSMVIAAAAIQNDALMVAFTALTLAVLGHAVRAGLRLPHVLVLGLCCIGGMLTRATFVGVLLAVLGVVAAVSLWPEGGGLVPTARRWGQALGRVAVVAVMTLLGAGWYYRLNDERYGDLIGGSVAYHLVRGRPKQPDANSTLHYLFSLGGIKVQVQQLGGGWDSLLGGGQLRRTDVLAGLITALLVLGVLALLVALARGRRWRDGPGWWLAIALVGTFVVAFVEVADHVAHGGGPNNRYLLSAIGCYAVCGGIALLLAGSRRWPVTAVLLVLLQAAGSINAAVILVHRLPPLGWRSWFSGLTDGMAQAGIPAGPAILVLLLILAAVGLLAQAAALAALGRLPRPDEPARADRPVPAV